MDPDALLRVAPALLRSHWEVTGARVQPLPGGMNSATCRIEAGGRSWVLKVVRAAHAGALRAGAAAAMAADHEHVRSGPPRPAPSGADTVTLDDGHEAVLLAWVDGEPLTGRSAAAQQLIGRTLARVHRRMPRASDPATEFFPWMRETAERYAVEPWIAPTVARVREALEAALPLAWAQLHTDPAPEAFRAGSVPGLIDWTGSVAGPRLYDLASAVMYVGGRGRAAALITAYLENDGCSEREVAESLDLLLAVRYAVQAAYFAQRVGERDLTGLADQRENVVGLSDARDRLRASGWLTT